MKNNTHILFNSFFYKKRSDGVIGYSLPCDTTCSECSYMIWQDSEPYGYLLDGLLECSENDDGESATQLFCNGEQLMFYNYDNCIDKQCQIISYPSTQDLCFYAGTKDICNNIEIDWKIKMCPSSSSSYFSPSLSFHAKMNELTFNMRKTFENKILFSRKKR